MLSLNENFKSFKFYPSIVIEPDWGSKSRNNRFKIVLFPDPLSPTIATKSPGFILKEKSYRTEVPGEYKNETLLNYI